MTPEVPSSPAAAGGGEFSSASSMMDSLLDTPSISSVPETKQAAPEPPVQRTAEVAEQPEVQEEQVEDQIEDPNDEDFDPDEEFVDQEGRKRYHVKPPRMAKLVAANKAWSQVAEFAPTVDAAREHYQAASDFRALQSDFASGEPEGVQNFMGYWSQGAPEAFQAMATQLPNYLATLASRGDQGSVQALRAIEGQVHRATIATAYDKAAQTKDPKDFYAAQALDFAINGKYIETADKIPVRQQQQPDRTQQERQRFDQERTRFENQRWQEFDTNAITGAKETSLKSAVEAAFKPFEGAFQGTPGLMAAAKREATAKVQEEITKQFEWNRNQTVEQKDIQRDFLKAIRTGEKTNLSQRAEQLVNEYKARVSRVLPGIVKSLIGEQTKTVMQQSAKTHENLARGANKTSPGSGGKAVPRDIFPTQNWKTPGEGLDALLGT